MGICIEADRLKRSKYAKELMINVRVSSHLKAWLDENDYNLSSLFVEACKSLGYKE